MKDDGTTPTGRIRGVGAGALGLVLVASSVALTTTAVTRGDPAPVDPARLTMEVDPDRFLEVGGTGILEIRPDPTIVGENGDQQDPGDEPVAGATTTQPATDDVSATAPGRPTAPDEPATTAPVTPTIPGVTPPTPTIPTTPPAPTTLPTVPTTPSLPGL